MNRQEIESLRLEIYSLWADNRGSKEAKTLKKVIKLITYTQELKHIINSIAKIGGKHHL